MPVYHIDLLQIFDIVHALATHYLDACQAGCVLFHEWRYIIHCGGNRKSNITFKHGRKISITTDKSLIEQIKKLCTFVEGCYQEWVTYCNTLRNECYFLNYFTIAQIVLLCRELAVAKETRSVAIVVLHMVRSLKSGVTDADLLLAVDDYCKKLSTRALFNEKKDPTV